MVAICIVSLPNPMLAQARLLGLQVLRCRKCHDKRFCSAKRIAKRLLKGMKNSLYVNATASSKHIVILRKVDFCLPAHGGAWIGSCADTVRRLIFNLLRHQVQQFSTAIDEMIVGCGWVSGVVERAKRSA